MEEEDGGKEVDKCEKVMNGSITVAVNKACRDWNGWRDRSEMQQRINLATG